MTRRIRPDATFVAEQADRMRELRYYLKENSND